MTNQVICNSLPRLPHIRVVSIVSVVLALWGGCTPALAAVTVPAVPSNINCIKTPACGLYMDFSGRAMVTPATGQSFSYQPSTQATNYRFANEALSDSGGGSLALLQATDFVSFGALKSQLSATSTTSGWFSNAPNAAAYADSNIHFQDSLTFNLAGVRAGTMGTMIGRMLVSGSVDASAALYPYTTTSASTSVFVSSSPALTYTLNAYGDRPPSGSIPNVITFALPVKFNATDFTVFNVQMQTHILTLALNQLNVTWAAAANANFFNSIEWGGIDKVLDANGNAITGWNVTSASGFDYSRSYVAQVPEPGAWAMMLGGLVLLGSLRRRLS